MTRRLLEKFLAVLQECRLLNINLNIVSKLIVCSVRGQLLGAVIAYNLKKWLNYQEQKLKTTVMAIKKKKEGLCFLFLMLWHSIAIYNVKTDSYSCRLPQQETSYWNRLHSFLNLVVQLPLLLYAGRLVFFSF